MLDSLDASLSAISALDTDLDSHPHSAVTNGATYLLQPCKTEPHNHDTSQIADASLPTLTTNSSSLFKPKSTSSAHYIPSSPTTKPTRQWKAPKLKSSHFCEHRGKKLSQSAAFDRSDSCPHVCRFCSRYT